MKTRKILTTVIALIVLSYVIGVIFDALAHRVPDAKPNAEVVYDCDSLFVGDTDDGV